MHGERNSLAWHERSIHNQVSMYINIYRIDALTFHIPCRVKLKLEPALGRRRQRRRRRRQFDTEGNASIRTGIGMNAEFIVPYAVLGGVKFSSSLSACSKSSSGKNESATAAASAERQTTPRRQAAAIAGIRAVDKYFHRISNLVVRLLARVRRSARSGGGEAVTGRSHHARANRLDCVRVER